MQMNGAGTCEDERQREGEQRMDVKGTVLDVDKNAIEIRSKRKKGKDRWVGG